MTMCAPWTSGGLTPSSTCSSVAPSRHRFRSRWSSPSTRSSAKEPSLVSCPASDPITASEARDLASGGCGSPSRGDGSWRTRPPGHSWMRRAAVPSVTASGACGPGARRHLPLPRLPPISDRRAHRHRPRPHRCLAGGRRPRRRTSRRSVAITTGSNTPPARVSTPIRWRARVDYPGGATVHHRAVGVPRPSGRDGCPRPRGRSSRALRHKHATDSSDAADAERSQTLLPLLLAQHLERVLQVVGVRRGDDLLARWRVGRSPASARAATAASGPRRADERRVGAVGEVADARVAQRGHVHPDLVGAAGLQVDVEQAGRGNASSVS